MRRSKRPTAGHTDDAGQMLVALDQGAESAVRRAVTLRRDVAGAARRVLETAVTAGDLAGVSRQAAVASAVHGALLAARRFGAEAVQAVLLAAEPFTGQVPAQPAPVRVRRRGA